VLLQPVPAVQHLVSDVRREIELEPGGVRRRRGLRTPRAAPGKNERIMLRTSRSLSRASTGLRFEPADLQPVAAAQAHQILDRQREAPLAHVVAARSRSGKSLRDSS